MTEKIDPLVKDICLKTPEFSKFNPRQIHFSLSYARTSRRAGLIAYVLPLRFKNGSPVEIRTRGEKEYHWAWMPLQLQGVEMLYIIYFVVPRFFNLTLKAKLETIFHELYHIHPDFTGDLRVFPGRSKLHGDTKAYEKKVEEMTQAYLAQLPDPNLFSFLKGRYSNFKEQFGEPIRFKEPRPTLVKTRLITEPSF